MAVTSSPTEAIALHRWIPSIIAALIAGDLLGTWTGVDLSVLTSLFGSPSLIMTPIGVGQMVGMIAAFGLIGTSAWYALRFIPVGPDVPQVVPIDVPAAALEGSREYDLSTSQIRHGPVYLRQAKVTLRLTGLLGPVLLTVIFLPGALQFSQLVFCFGNSCFLATWLAVVAISEVVPLTGLCFGFAYLIGRLRRGQRLSVDSTGFTIWFGGTSSRRSNWSDANRWLQITDFRPTRNPLLRPMGGPPPILLAQSAWSGPVRLTDEALAAIVQSAAAAGVEVRQRRMPLGGMLVYSFRRSKRPGPE